MNRLCVLKIVVLLALSLAAVSPAWGQYQVQRFSSGELDQLVGPIALYPDPLLAQVLPASTFLDDINSAAGFSTGDRDDTWMDDQDWDISVRSVAHYPRVLSYMADRPDWTTSLGQAYVYQQVDTLDAIQRLRHRAYRLGYLFSTNDQQVIVEGSYIRIVPADPSLIYVPTYNPNVVFVRQAPRHDVVLRDVLIFGLGIAIGSWLDRDTDWGRHRVFYHGWQGGGWISRSRSHVTINNVYVNNTFVNQPIRTNRSILSRNISPYRSQLKRNVGVFVPPPTITRRGGVVKSNTGVGNGLPPRTTNRIDRTIKPSSHVKSGSPGASTSTTGSGISGRRTKGATSGGSSLSGGASGQSGHTGRMNKSTKAASDRSKRSRSKSSTDKTKVKDSADSSGGNRSRN